MRIEGSASSTKSRADQATRWPRPTEPAPRAPHRPVPTHVVCDVPCVGDASAFDDDGFPLIAGGQGRSAEDVEAAATGFVAVVAFAVAFFGLAAFVVWAVA